MPSAVIEVSFVNPPAAGKKMGSIKAADGTYYGIGPEKITEFQKGGVYEIFFEDREWQGKTYHTIKSVTPHESKTAPAAAKVLEQATQAYPKTANGVGDRNTNRHIFVCGLMNNATHGMGLEVLSDRDKLRLAIDNCTRAYDQSLLSSPQKNDEMGEEVPY